jgi:hypothetical protein
MEDDGIMVAIIGSTPPLRAPRSRACRSALST